MVDQTDATQRLLIARGQTFFRGPSDWAFTRRVFQAGSAGFGCLAKGSEVQLENLSRRELNGLKGTVVTDPLRTWEGGKQVPDLMQDQRTPTPSRGALSPFGSKPTGSTEVVSTRQTQKCGFVSWFPFTNHPEMVAFVSIRRATRGQARRVRSNLCGHRGWEELSSAEDLSGSAEESRTGPRNSEIHCSFLRPMQTRGHSCPYNPGQCFRITDA